MNFITDYIIKKQLDTLLSQIESFAKAKEKRAALAQGLNRILSKIENEPYYNTLSKIIINGSLANQIIFYCENVPVSGKSIKTFCDDIVAGCKINTLDKSKVNGVIYKIAVCFFNIINNPKDSDVNEAVNIVLQSNAGDFESIRALLFKILDLLDRGLKPKDFVLSIPIFTNPPFSKNDYFSNREDILDKISEGFSSGQTTQYLSGKGGIGKTQIALEYAFRHEGEYDTICWVNSETETALLQSYQYFADTMQLLPVPKEVQTSEMIIKSVLNWLDTHDNWLIIYDNIEDITSDSPWWPKCNRGNRLLTTQKSDLHIGEKLEVIEFSPNEAVNFLKKRTKKQGATGMEAVANRLGYHPLALEQAAAYIVHNKDTTFASYLQLLEDHGLTALEETKDKDIIDYHRSVTATMEIAIAKIEMEAAKQLLYLCSYLASENIDPALFNENAELLPDPLKIHLSDDLLKKRVWRALTEYSLLEFREGKKGYSIHRLLQEVVRRKIGDDQQWAQCCLELIYKVFRFMYGDVVSHTQFMKLLPHVEALLKNIELCLTDEPEQAQIAQIYDEGGFGQYYLCNYTQALEWYVKALVIEEKMLGKEHPDTVITYNNIASIYSSQGDYPKALAWHEKALAIREKMLGKKHPDTATSYNNIASVYESLGAYPTALAWYEKALAISEKVLGKEHPSTAATYNNIAVVYDSQGDYPKALEWYEKALTICEKVLGKEHPNTATIYNNIALVYKRQGDNPKALMWYLKDLAISEKVLGKEHPGTATTYNNIAAVYQAQGDYPKALEWYEKALTIREKVLGKEHPDTATTYNNIAVVYDSQGDYPKALEWYEKALAIKERVLGKEHPSTAATYNNIADVYESQGDYPKALEWYQKDLAISEKVLGKEHPSTAATYNNIAGVYDSQGDYPKALEWYEKALAITEKVLGKEHPSTAATYNNIAGVYNSQGDYPKALEWYEKALAIREKVLGKVHPSIAATYNNIGGVYNSQGDCPKALEWYEKALAIAEKVLGKVHPSTAAMYNNIAGVYKSQGDYPKALEWYQKDLAISEKVLGKEHPDTAATYNNIAFVYDSQGDYPKALEWYLKAYAILKTKLGEDHPYTKSSLESIRRLQG